MQTDYFRQGRASSREPAHEHPVSGIDLLGYAVVIVLVLYLVYLWLQPDPQSRIAEYAPIELSVDGQSRVDASDTSRDGVVALIRTSAPNESLAQPSRGRGPTDQTLEQLMGLAQQPGWLLLDSDIRGARRALADLLRDGPSALPLLQRYLAQLDEDVGEGSAIMMQLGYPTLRLALFDLVRQIGGHSAEDIFYQSMQQTSSPLEIETLGRYLEEQSPGLYGPDILRAARDRFSLAEHAGGERINAGPLFQVFARYGDASLASDLEQLSQLRWGRYGALALSRLPEGAGLSSLARWVEEGPEGNTTAEFAIGILAQSAEYPEAQQALIDSVRADRITDARWPEVARLLMGTYYIQLEPPQAGVVTMQSRGQPVAALLKSRKYVSLTPGGPQVLFGLELSAPTLAFEQIEPRLELIDALLSETDNPVAKQELTRAEQALWSLLQRQQEQ